MIKSLDEWQMRFPSEVEDSAKQGSADRLAFVTTYAASIGLRRFSLTPPYGAEYATEEPVGNAGYCRTAAQVIEETGSHGRRRIKVPFRLFGHVVITEPEFVAGLFWYLDLLKAGYLFIHFLTPFERRRAFLPRVFALALLDRCSTYRVRTVRTALECMAKWRKPSYQAVSDRVLMITGSLMRGGSERQLLTMASALLDRGYDIKIFVLKPSKPGVISFEEDVARLGITAEFLSEAELARVNIVPPPSGVRLPHCAALPRQFGLEITAIASAIKRHRPSVVHGWLDNPGVEGALAACVLGTPRVVIQIGSMVTHGNRFRRSELLRQACRMLARNPTVTMLNNSIAGARDYEQWLSLPARAISVMYNAFDPASARMPEPQETAQLRASLGLSTDAMVVGTVMRFCPEKDPDLWLDTAAEIAGSRPNVRFLICGYGELEGRIKEKIKALNLTESVVLAGPAADVGLFYSAMDVVLLTSAIEGLPNVAIEAQAVGRPVVATDVGGTSEAVLEGQTGAIVRSRSAEHIAKEVIAVLDSIDQRSLCTIEGPKFVARRFGVARMIDEILVHYAPEKIISSPDVHPDTQA
jgi:glycosyltransferase involved in cell wall biosynthesis